MAAEHTPPTGLGTLKPANQPNLNALALPQHAIILTSAHGWLTHHANCAGADVLGLSDATGYDSDDDRCPCTYHPVAIEERASHYHACRAWPGPICGECWAASCECGFVFETADDAHSRWPSGRLCCAACSTA